MFQELLTWNRITKWRPSNACVIDERIMDRWGRRRDIKRGNVMNMVGGLDERLGGMVTEGFLGLDCPHSNISFFRSLINSGILGTTSTTLLLFLRSQGWIWVSDEVSDAQVGLSVHGLPSEVGPIREPGTLAWLDVADCEGHVRWVSAMESGAKPALDTRTKRSLIPTILCTKFSLSQSSFTYEKQKKL